MAYTYAAWENPYDATIYYPATDDDFVSIASVLKAHYSDNFGIEVPVVEGAYTSGKAIIFDIDNSLTDGYCRVYVEDGNLIFLADSTITMNVAVEIFVKMTPPRNMAAVFEIVADADKAATITVTDMTNKQHTYAYVWGDEFNNGMTDEKQTYDRSKWIAGVKRMNVINSVVKGHEMKLSGDTDAIYVSNGAMTLRNYKVKGEFNWSHFGYDYTYVCPDNLQTTDKMNYRYGYLEIRAKVPVMTSVWPSFWLESVKGESTQRTPPYVENVTGPISDNFLTEYDIFEADGAKFDFTTHKHYKKTIDDVAYRADTANIFATYAVSDTSKFTYEYHTFGFEWTPTTATVYIDGVAYGSMDITTTFDTQEAVDEQAGSGIFNASDISGFHDPMQIIFNNHLFMDRTEGDGNGEGCVEFNSSYTSSEYVIDYVRLYQDPTMNDDGAVYGKDQVLYSGLWTK